MNVAVIGVGSMGKNHARILHEMKSVKLLLCDNDAAKEMIARGYNAPLEKTIKELWNKYKIDAAIISTPTIYHKKIAFECIKRKIPVLIEKPISVTVKEAEDIVKYAQKNKVLLAVGHVEQFNPVIKKLQALILSQDLGEIVDISVKRVGINAPNNKSVNVITDLAIHDLDIICSLMGELPNRVYAKGGITIGEKFEDYAEAILEFKNAASLIQVNWVTPIKIRKLSITFTGGYVELNYLTQVLRVYKKQRITNAKNYRDLIDKYAYPESFVFRLKKKEPLKEEIKNFLYEVKGKSGLIISGAQAIRALKVAEALNMSLERKKIISL